VHWRDGRGIQNFGQKMRRKRLPGGFCVGRMILKWNFMNYGGRVWNGPVGESSDHSKASARFINKGEFLHYLSQY
jgi:hypothetical protein